MSWGPRRPRMAAAVCLLDRALTARRGLAQTCPALRRPQVWTAATGRAPGSHTRGQSQKETAGPHPRAPATWTQPGFVISGPTATPWQAPRTPGS